MTNRPHRRRPSAPGLAQQPTRFEGPGVLLVGPVLLELDRVLRRGVRDAQVRDGISPGPRLSQALAEIEGAARRCQIEMTLARHSLAARPARGAESSLEPGLCTVEGAARVLRLSRRQVQRLAPELGGQRIGRVWVFDEQRVKLHAADRARRTE